MSSNVWVAVEVTRRLRLVDGELAPASGLTVGGVNLLQRQVKLALRLAPADNVMLLTPQPDEYVLELAGEHELRAVSPMEFIGAMTERAGAGEAGAVVLLRQTCLLRDAAPVLEAIQALAKHPVLISASVSPPGSALHDAIPGEDDPDHRCQAFEVRRLSEFTKDAMAAIPGRDDALHFIPWDSFAELNRPTDEPLVAERLRAWGG